MYGVYAWNAGASSAQVLADLVRWITGGDVAGMSASCNKPASSVAGSGAGDWSAIDSAFGVVHHAGIVTGPGVAARLSISGASKVQMAVVDGWNVGTHAASHATSALDVSLSLASAGSVNLLAVAGVLGVASSDWSSWCLAAEVKRSGPAVAGAAAKSGAILLTSSAQHFMARVKTPGSSGETAGAYVTVQSAYGALSGAAARDQSERLYLPMAPATVAYSQVPVEEVAGVQIVGGYALSGDAVVDEAAVTYLAYKAGGYTFAVAKV